MQISFCGTLVDGATVESVEITLGDREKPIITCTIPFNLIRKYFPHPVASVGPTEADATVAMIRESPRIELLVTRVGEDDLEEVLRTLEEGIQIYDPEMSEEGVNGTYFMKDQEGNIVAVFKPHDEEGTSSSNPKYSEDDAEADLNKGLLPGEGVLREVAAYMLDHHHFSGVPRTSLAKVNQFHEDRHAIGSLQEFVANDGASWDIGPNAFPSHEVHKIGILDLRIMNADRHGGNILINRSADGTYSLTPIDHGFSLTDNLGKAWFDWISWPQAKRPFDAESLAYIAALDIEQDARILEGLGIRRECIRTMRISTYLLKMAAFKGLNLFQIGSIASRLIYNEASELETLAARALEEACMQEPDLLDAENERKFLEKLYRLMDATVESRI